MKRYRARRYFVLRPNGRGEQAVESVHPTRAMANAEAERRQAIDDSFGFCGIVYGPSRDVVPDRRRA